MSYYFADTSALAKRYLAMESGAAWVKTWISSPQIHTVMISELAITELNSVLGRRHREGTLTTKDLNALLKGFRWHVRQDYQVIRLRTRLLNNAAKLTRQYPLRTLDAIQLASALITQQILGLSPLFVSADDRLLQVASQFGFPTDNPNWHP